MANQSSGTVVSVGIDVSKDTLDSACLCSDQTVKRLSVKNTTAGINDLVRFLHEQGTAETVPCVIESTGDLHLLSACSLTHAGFMVKLINPLLTKRYQKASIRNAKSDRIDAARLATIGLMEPALPAFVAKENSIVCRKLISYLGKLETLRQQLAQSTKQLEQTVHSLGTATTVVLPDMATVIKALDEQIDMFKQMIIQLAPPEAAVLAAATPGLSETQAAIILGALSDKHFFHKDSLVAFVGLDPMLRQSGSWQGRQKLSKRGNPYLRKILYQTAWSLKQHNPIFKAYYDRLYRKDGKHYTTTMIATARKFLKFLYAYYWEKTIQLSTSPS